ncbi:MAG: GFA family protein [Pseudomonadota bacterium]
MYCHCSDCRRLSGAPVAAFAAFARDDLHFDPPLADPHFEKPGVSRWSCSQCHAQLAATYDYLPGQIYVPIGLFDQMDLLQPSAHAHVNSTVSWLHIEDDLPRIDASSRDLLNEAAS